MNTIIPLPSFLCLILAASTAFANPPDARLPEKHRAFFTAHCLDCHDSETREGKVDLETLPFRINTLEQAELWQKVLNTLNAGEMPPEDSEQPGNTQKADFLDDLAKTMVTARQALSDSGGKITMRRLNRREYRNTIEQLTGARIDVGSLPSDGGSGTFDTVGASQFISSDQFEQYLKLGRQAIDEVFERQAARKAESTESSISRVEPEKTINPDNEKEIAQTEERQKRFHQWKKGVDEAARTPENQAIIAEIRKTNRLIDHPNRFYTFADRFKGTPNPRDFGFVDAAKAAASDPSRSRDLALHQHFASLPHRDRGTYLKLAHGTGRVIVPPQKKELPPGRYVLRVRVGAVEGTPAERRFIQVGHPQRQIASRNWGLAGRAISTHQVTGTIDHPETIEIPLEVTATTIPEFAVQEKQPNNGNLKALWNDHNKWKKENGYGHPPAIWIDWVELEGPLNSSGPTISKQRREVEEHANAKVGGTYNGYFKRGHDKAQEFLKTGKPQKGIVDEQEAKFRIRSFNENGPSFRRYLEDPLTKTGSLLTIHNMNTEEFIALPPEQPSGWRKTKHVVEKLPPGDYKLRFRIGAIAGTPSERHFVDIGAVPQQNQFDQLNTFQITGTTDAPQIVEFPVSLTETGPRKFALREKRDPKGDLAWYRAARKKTGVGPPPALWIDWVEWEGPFESRTTPSPLQQILARNAAPTERQDASRRSDAADKPAASDLPLTASPDAQRARAVLSEFAHTAFRDVSPESDFIDRLVAIYETRRETGHSFDEAIRTPLSVILASPGFLYLYEPGDEALRRPLNDRELAVRLAYFLWSGPPDTELLQLAQQNQLHLPEVLRQQVDRLIADPRSDDFVAGFVHQWLDMERLDFFQFDVNLYRDFDESTRAATREEVYQSFAHLLRHSSLTLRVGQSHRPEPAPVPNSSLTLRVGQPRRPEPAPVPNGSLTLRVGQSHRPEPAPVPNSSLTLRVGQSRRHEPAPVPNSSLTPRVGQSRRPEPAPVPNSSLTPRVGQPHRPEPAPVPNSSLTLRVGQSASQSQRQSARPDSESQATSSGGRIGKLLKSDYVFVNGLLATYYGIEGVTGDEFRKIELPANSPRGGLLGMAAIHAMGSDGVVSSPVERGAWVLRHLLNDPPPPAPPNVPQISRLNDQVLTTRQRLLAHQEEAQCASCHRKIDPIGFGLENWDAAGKWRTEDSDGSGRQKKTWKIDASGAFHNGPAFRDYHELRDLIAAREEDFARGFTEHLIEYALGRPFGFTDDDLANEVVGSAKSKNFAVSEFIHALVQSEPFQSK